MNPGKREMDARQRRVALGRLLVLAKRQFGLTLLEVFAPERLAQAGRARIDREDPLVQTTPRDGGRPCRGDRCTRGLTARTRPGRGIPSPGRARCRPARRRRPTAGGRPSRRAAGGPRVRARPRPRRPARGPEGCCRRAVGRGRTPDRAERPRETPREPQRGDSAADERCRGCDGRRPGSPPRASTSRNAASARSSCPALRASTPSEKRVARAGASDCAQRPGAASSRTSDKETRREEIPMEPGKQRAPRPAYARARRPLPDARRDLRTRTGPRAGSDVAASRCRHSTARIPGC